MIKAKNTWRKILSWGGLAVVLAIAIALFPRGAALSQTAAQAEILIRDRGGITSNQATFDRVQYIGQCSGLVYIPKELRGQFVSNTTPPAPGRRAILRNVTKGINNDPFPYTDREYDDGRYSEGFDLQINYDHSQRDFAVVTGSNTIEYEIKEGGSAIEQGSFNLEVTLNDRGFVPREAICREEWQCANKSGKDDDDDDRDRRRRYCRPLTTCSCP